MTQPPTDDEIITAWHARLSAADVTVEIATTARDELRDLLAVPPTGARSESL